MIKIRQATPADKDIPRLSYSKGVAINTCPTWGIIGYEKALRIPRAGREMALEAGAACHEVFAALRYATLFEGSHHDLAVEHAIRAFGTDRHTEAYRYFRSSEGVETRRRDYSLSILDTSTFYDDPIDKRRTRSNLSDSCTAYIQRYNFDAWQPHVDEKLGFVGVEVPFDLVVSVDDQEFRFVGIIDALINNRKFKNIEPHENKTGSRINDVWALSFAMSHQVTGYCLAATHILGREEYVTDALIHGLQIPLPRNTEGGGIISERVTRQNYHFERWAKWNLTTLETVKRYKDSPLDAPKFTHSCNRYFRPCPLITFCTLPNDEQAMMLQDEFEHVEGSVLEDKVGD